MITVTFSVLRMARTFEVWPGPVPPKREDIVTLIDVDPDGPALRGIVARREWLTPADMICTVRVI